jgi:hypothetical protein
MFVSFVLVVLPILAKTHILSHLSDPARVLVLNNRPETAGIKLITLLERLSDFRNYGRPRGNTDTRLFIWSILAIIFSLAASRVT